MHLPESGINSTPWDLERQIELNTKEDEDIEKNIEMLLAPGKAKD